MKQKIGSTNFSSILLLRSIEMARINPQMSIHANTRINLHQYYEHAAEPAEKVKAIADPA